MPSADNGAIVEVTLGSANIISVFPSDEILRPAGKDPQTNADRIQWCVCTPQHVFAFRLHVHDITAGSETSVSTRRKQTDAPRNALSK